MDVHQYCQERAAASGSSFYYSFVFLQPEMRRAITAFYALCRELDDVVDECRERQVAEAKLDWWRAEIGRFANGAPEHPATRALFDTPQGRAIPPALLLEVVDGMAMDLDHTRYPDFKSLNLYCYRVAGVVGEIAASIFDGTRGEHDRDIRRYAHELGLAFQLTNIIRDVGEDARRGRIYLPQDELVRFGVHETDLLSGRNTPEFQTLMQFQYERALACYGRAFAALPPGARHAQRPGLVMAAIYRTLLSEIRQSGFPVLHARVSLTPLRKLWLASKTWLFP
ncbi:MAG: presqualene diphosphate synthase HpnD [Thiobacillus sp.]|uniref:presqualene diphosphate synthase HpnD n=1 Tax=unclassified Thiobacillus TaxID=2646513 RepID=UPI00086E7629|nr:MULTISPECIES: presqualene diphosphate synthase HpnD [unclassified Thiobacillus]MBN8770389.1 presqualene diphosphate synthase HpnD [Thiobacillus sp.]MBN8779659.1 presqualene diphosphate synthase HpnD [Thiobacillus sp.]ODU99794.1 MAG: squalene synthase HpnD [Thiobacillus sp. SCN 63-57]